MVLASMIAIAALTPIAINAAESLYQDWKSKRTMKTTIKRIFGK